MRDPPLNCRFAKDSSVRSILWEGTDQQNRIQTLCQQIIRKNRQRLEADGLWDKSRRLQKHELEYVAIPVTTDNLALLRQCLNLNTADVVDLISADLPLSKSHTIITPFQTLKNKVQELLEHETASHVNFDQAEIERLLCEVPAHWEKHGDLVLLPSKSFSSSVWQMLGEELWEIVARCVNASRVAKQAAIRANGYRSPQVQLMLGADTVVQHTENGIRYEYDLTHCMFSKGNITEKLRIASFHCKEEIVVDLFAGIGYFTLPYLVHAKAKHVHACEWNPDAVQALQRNLCLNHVADRCTIHPGDNRQLTLKGVADRVNLGLIPSSEESWPVACRVLKPTGGMLHVHSNVNIITAAGESLKSAYQENAMSNEKESYVKAANDCSFSAMPVSVIDLNLVSCGPSSEPHQCPQHHSKKCCPSANSLSDCAERNTDMNRDVRGSDNSIEQMQGRSLSPSASCTRELDFRRYGEGVCKRLKALLELQQGGFWQAVAKHTEVVKSYAPHIFHIVLDVECKPDCSC